MRLLQTELTDLAADADQVRRARYGMIECVGGKLRAVSLRPWPKFVTVDMIWWGYLTHSFRRGDRCRLFYNEPRGCPGYLTLKYAISSHDCTLRTMVRTLAVLDEIAWIKRTDAIVCDAWNTRISHRSMARFGWEPHLPDRWHRYYIKRFYGEYPMFSKQALRL